MKRKAGSPSYLGIECGGTRTVALLADADARIVRRHVFGPANLRLLTDRELLDHFRVIAKAAPRPTALAIGMAGARSDKDFQRLRRVTDTVWHGVPAHLTNDLYTALAAAPMPSPVPDARILVLSGTGSCCFGISKGGRCAKVGGWGHILGDKGSAYQIGLRGLKAAIYYYDRNGVWPRLGQRLLRKLCLNEPDDFIGWVQSASKADIAALAVEVFAAWGGRDHIANDILDAAANSLAKDAVACAARLGEGGCAQFVLAGGVLLNQPRFSRRVATLIRRLWRRAVITPLTRESALGAVSLASGAETVSALQPETRADLRQLALSPTEQRNPRSMKLDELPVASIIRLMLSEDETIPPAILKEAKKLERVIGWVIRAFRNKGRLFYVGAGTSGRLGVLDASECPPTFRADPEMVQGIIAGGQRALWEAVEGAEDDPTAGAQAVAFRRVSNRDVIVGIAASGRTPFVWGALEEARNNGARTVLIAFNPKLSLPRAWRPDIIIAPNVGPEILTGSTRLKSGTATKLILNMFTTIAMVRMGKTLSNLMVDVKASNRKLRDRAVRILQQLTDSSYAHAMAALERSNWDIKIARRTLARKQDN